MSKKDVKFPVMNVQMIPMDQIVSNDYNPNKVPHERLKALIKSIEYSGVTMPIVAYQDGDRYVIIDGFHRYKVLKDHFKVDEAPVTVVDLPIDKRISATMLHNTARGEHIVDLEAALVKKLQNQGKSLQQIADLLQLEGEATLRLNANTTLKDRYAKRSFSKSWE